MGEHIHLGRVGEDKAVAYLEAQDYVILERNWRYRHWEVDVICRDRDVIVIAEVKTRLEGTEYPEELMDYRKRRNLLSAGAAYIRVKKIEAELRFDLIIVSGREWNIQHIKEAIQIFD